MKDTHAARALITIRGLSCDGNESVIDHQAAAAEQN